MAGFICFRGNTDNFLNLDRVTSIQFKKLNILESREYSDYVKFETADGLFFCGPFHPNMPSTRISSFKQKVKQCSEHVYQEIDCPLLDPQGFIKRVDMLSEQYNYDLSGFSHLTKRPRLYN